MYGVQRTSERPLDGALGWIDRKDQVADACLRRSSLRQSNEPSKGRDHARPQQSQESRLSFATYCFCHLKSLRGRHLSQKPGRSLSYVRSQHASKQTRVTRQAVQNAFS